MAKDPIPWFKFYPDKFMHGVRGLTAQEVGVYQMMLCRIYEENGPVEFNILRLSTYCGMRKNTFQKTIEKLIELGKLTLENNLVSNARADSEIASRANDLKISSRGGKVSAQKRQQNQQKSSSDGQAKANHLDKDKERKELTKVSSKNTKKSKSSTPRQELEKVLSPEMAENVIEHRQRIKKPMTGYAAALLAKELSKAINPNAAADVMINRGWAGFKVDWLHRDNNSAPKRTLAQVAMDRVRDESERTEHEQEQANSGADFLISHAKQLGT